MLGGIILCSVVKRKYVLPNMIELEPKRKKLDRITGSQDLFIRLQKL